MPTTAQCGDIWSMAVVCSVTKAAVHVSVGMQSSLSVQKIEILYSWESEGRLEKPHRTNGRWQVQPTIVYCPRQEFSRKTAVMGRYGAAPGMQRLCEGIEAVVKESLESVVLARK